METVYTGSTNLDGSGSAANLNNVDAYAQLTNSGSVVVDGSVLSTIDIGSIASVTSVTVDNWNQAGFKEVQVNSEADNKFIFVENFVDVDINATGENAHVVVSDAKRGEITTGEGNDTVFVSVNSNGGMNTNWANHFEIDTGAGNDHIVMTDSNLSNFTSLDINAGSGDDVVNISGLSNAFSHYSDVTREIEGGEGNDAIFVSGEVNGSEHAVSLSGFEAIIGVGDASVNVTSDLLENNYFDVPEGFDDVTGELLVLSDIDVSLGDGIVVLDWDSELVDLEEDLITSVGLDTDLDDYSWVLLGYMDGDEVTHSSILTNDELFIDSLESAIA